MKHIMKKNWIIIISLIIGSGVLVSNYGGTIPYALFYFSFLVPLTSLVYIVIVWNRFRFHQRTEKKTIVKGENADYHFCLGNEDKFLYSGIKVYFLHDNSYIIGLDETKEYCLMPGEKVDIKTKLCCKYRGEYFVGVQSFVITDYLHLFNITYEVGSRLPVTVLPRIIKWKNADIIEEDKDEKNTISSAIKEDQIDVQVRKYSTGDSIRQIHWKASAKSGELMTRIYHSSVKREVMILLDLSPVVNNEKDKLLIEDGIIEEALAAANYFYQNKIPCFVCFEQRGYKKLSIQTIDEWNKFYLLCAKLLFEGKYKNIELCEASKPWIKTVKHAIIVTHELSAKLYNELKSFYAGVETCILLIVNVLSNEEKNRMKFFMDSGFTVRLIKAGGETKNEN
jgi:hypothetical protein